ncbi:cytochrome b/b6 domain-containing protein [Thiolapillus sp.]
MPSRSVKIFSGFERFWHWAQMLLIFMLLFTGLRIHGVYGIISFDQAVWLHTWSALFLVALWVFAVFWHLTTGAWRHYLPTTKGLWPVLRFYAWDIFRGKAHPYRKHFWRKHNPLQALTYLGLKLFLFPAIWVSGLLYLTYNYWQDGVSSPWLPWVAVVHVLSAYAIAAFVIIHVYMLTTGGSFRHHVMPMINGYDEVELTPAEEAYLQQDEPGRILGASDHRHSSVERNS